MPIAIPARQRKGLTFISGLSDAAFEQLVAALAAAANPRTALETVMAADIPQVPPDQLETVVQTVSSIHQVRAFRGQQVKPFIRDISAAMETPIDDSPVIAPEQLDTFSSRLEKLLGIERFLTFSKALTLQYESGFVIHGTRILTDLRPVFPDDADAGASGFLLMHTLKISYSEHGEPREIYFSLDASELKQIKDAFNRAETKAAQLRKLMHDKSMPNLTP